MLIKLTAISAIVVSVNASTWLGKTSFLTTKITNLPKSTYSVKRTVSTRWILILVAQVDLGGPR